MPTHSPEHSSDDWNNLSADLKQKWNKLTDEDIREADGNIDFLIGKLRELYGMSREDAIEQIAKMRTALDDGVEGAAMTGGRAQPH